MLRIKYMIYNYTCSILVFKMSIYKYILKYTHVYAIQCLLGFVTELLLSHSPLRSWVV